EVDVGPGLEHLAGDIVALRHLGARGLAEGDLAAAPRLLLLVQLLAECLVDVGSLARILLLLRAGRLESEQAECDDSAGESLEPNRQPNRHGQTPNGRRAGTPQARRLRTSGGVVTTRRGHDQAPAPRPERQGRLLPTGSVAEGPPCVPWQIVPCSHSEQVPAF